MKATRRRLLPVVAAAAALAGVVAAIAPSAPTAASSPGTAAPSGRPTSAAVGSAPASAAGAPGERAAAPGNLHAAAVPPTPTAGAPGGPASKPPPRANLSLATLGDSVPGGANCSCPPFGDIYAALLTQRGGRPVSVHNFGVDGQTSATLKDEIVVTGSPQAQAVADAAVVTITVGANDFDEMIVDSAACADVGCYHDTLAALRTNLTDIINGVRRLAPARPPLILVTGYWNVFLDGAVGRGQGSAYQQASDRLTVAANAVIADVARRGSARYVDLYAPFKATGDDTGLLTDDGGHPNAAGHTLIARQLQEATPAAP